MNQAVINQNYISEILEFNHIVLDNNRVAQMQKSVKNLSIQQIKNISQVLFIISTKLHYAFNEFLHNDFNNKFFSNEQTTQNDQEFKQFIKDYLDCYSIQIPKFISESLNKFNKPAYRLQVPIRILKNVLDKFNNNASFHNFIKNKTITWKQ